MKNQLLLIAGMLSLGGCATQRVHQPVAQELRQPGVEPQVFSIEDRNTRMRAAVRKARKTVGVFIAALKNPKPGQKNFEVKKVFIQGDEVEHLWLANVHLSGNRFHGYVDNKPRKIKNLKIGDRVSVNPDEISDWAFIENGRLVGGYTIRALYRTLPPDQQKELENEVNFKIGHF
jgi:uncharacterized protein YegJ (DUF2314 family)